MTAETETAGFLGHYGFPVHGPDTDGVIAGLLYDMEQSLAREPGLGPLDGVEAMIPTWRRPPDRMPQNRAVIVIDAGGTNFRSCLVRFDSAGYASVSDLEKKAMPAIDREYTKEEFYREIARNLAHLKGKADTIGFCFSYAMQIMPDGDGKVLEFSKEIKAEEVVGTLVGKSLSDALAEEGWKRPEKIVLVNDTTAALLAGAACASGGRLYDSYAGFILGTGMNSAYIEPGPIGKIAGTADDTPEPQIVVCEVGSYDRLPISFFDKEVEKTSKFPGRFVMEKMSAGGYLGSVVSSAVRTACKDGLFSDGFVQAFRDAGSSFELPDMDRFLYTPYDCASKLGSVAASGSGSDYDRLYLVLDAFIERAARLAAAAIAAAVIKSGKGRHPVRPVCVLCNGTTFHRTHNLKPRVMEILDRVLISERGLYFELVSIDNDITLGTAIAAVS